MSPSPSKRSMDLLSRFECERCEKVKNHYYIIEDAHAGDVICGGCGLVVGDRFIDVSSEWGTGNPNEPNDANYWGHDDPSRDVSLRNVSSNNELERPIRKAAEKYKYHSPWTPHSQKSFQRPPKQVGGTKASRRPKECRNLMVEVFGTENLTPNFTEIEAVPKSVSGWISYFCKKMNLSEEIEKASLAVAEKARDSGVSHGRTNTCVAASAIYLASQNTDAAIKMQSIAQTTGTNVTNIRKFCEDLHYGTVFT